MMRDDRCVYAPEPNMTPATPYNLLMPPIRILIVDDHPIMRIGITALIASSKEMEVVAQAASGEEALALHALHHPDITLMDLRLPGGNDSRHSRPVPQGPVYRAHHL
jgi:AmiR/NasT family two-component response regulator